MKKKLLISLMLALIALFVYQEATLAGITGKIAGVIKDAATGEPLPAVNIIIEGTTLGGATDNEGHYFIINIPPGTYTLQASMVGYTVESRTGVIVNVDHTTPVDFNLSVTAIAGEEVTVTAEREIIPMDISASHIVADAEQIIEVPMVTDIAQYIHLQAGIEGNYIRGGGLDQTAFMMDGLIMVDNQANRPMMMVNLSSVKELNIIKGGFNPEYDNVRSGLINIVTKEGSPNLYHGSIDYRYSPPHYKHSGVSIFNHNNFYLRPYLDEDVCWVGTRNGAWDEEMQEKYYEFMGWDAIAEKIEGMSAEDCRNLFMWRTLAEGSSALAPEGYERKEGKYGDKPDWNVDASFGGPVPYIGKYLGNLSFFTSYRNNWEAFGLPTYRDYYKEQNVSLKLTSRITSSMKLTFEVLYGVINSVSKQGQGAGIDYYLTSGDEIFDYASSGSRDFYWGAARNPFDVYRSMQGISFDHVLSPSTFYNVRITHVFKNNFCGGPGKWRDPTPVVQFGNHWADEEPYGFYAETGQLTMENDQNYSGQGGTTRDWSELNTINVKFDLTSQIDKYNQIKFGWMVNYDDINSDYMQLMLVGLANTWKVKWRQYPYRVGAYVQDKLEFEGMIANFGVRLDYNDSNCEWFTVDRYSKYFKHKEDFTEVCPKEPAKGHMKISPRLGVSHPISENAKLYFNYGHFYSMPVSDHMYRIRYQPYIALGISSIGNPSADLPKTVAYELGVEYNVRNLFLIHLAGYYKDVSDQTGWVSYTNYDGSVDYDTIENNNYADIRGFELRIDKRFGRWITGWLNYNYMVTTSGYVGRKQYYQDERMARIYGLQNPYQSTPLARPVARASLNIRTPGDWGPTIAGIKPFGDIRWSTLFTWKAGRYMTWDPLLTYELKNNLQWKGDHNFDARFSKRVRFGKYNLELFADINNLLNTKRLDTLGFSDTEDSDKYYESLHLPMYEGERYQEAGYIAGDDKPGDIKSDDKPYINMPNREFLTFLNPRTIFFGLKFDF